MDAAQLADTALILQRNTDLVNLRAAGLITEEAFQAGQRQLAELASAAIAVPLRTGAGPLVAAVTTPAHPSVSLIAESVAGPAPSATPGPALTAGAATAAREPGANAAGRAVAPARAARPTVVRGAGIRSVLSLPGFTRTTMHRGVEVEVAPPQLNFGRYKCSNTPSCAFATDSLSGLRGHERHCCPEPADDTPGRARVSSPGGDPGSGGEEEEEGSGSDSDRGAAAGGHAAGRRKRQRRGGEDGRKNNRGARRRKSYAFEEKAAALDTRALFLERGESAGAAATSLGISEACLSKWYSDADSIYEAAADKLKRSLKQKHLKASAGTARYPAMEERLVEELKRLRARGRGLSIRWLVTRARQLFADLYPGEAFLASRSWRRRFAKRYKLTRLKKTNTKLHSVAERLPKVQEWHTKLALLVSSPNPRAPEVPLHLVEGRFLMKNRFNMDQVGLEFVCGDDRTYDFIGEPKVQCKQQSEGLSKRVATLNACIGGADFNWKNLKTGVIFKGAGQVSKAERLAYDPRVFVQFQAKAWMDRPTALAWVENVWIPFTQSLPSKQELLLFLDNLDAHAHLALRALLKDNANTLAWMLPPGCTDILQPVDAGAGKLMKYLYGLAQDEWLDLMENLELWESGKMTASQRRILMTQWVGKAIETYNSQRYADTRRRLFEKTGCFMTADGSGDHRIQPEGVQGRYTFERLDPAEHAAGDQCAELDAAAAAAAAATAGAVSDSVEELPPDADEPVDFGFEDSASEDDDDDEGVQLITFEQMVSTALREGEQWRFSPAAPMLDAALVGKYVAVRLSDVGWCVGKVCGRSAPGTKSYNFKVTYDADDVAQHLFAAAQYVPNVVTTAAEAPEKWASMAACKPGAWVMFHKGVLPRVPARRAPLPALEALGSQALRR